MLEILYQNFDFLRRPITLEKAAQKIVIKVVKIDKPKLRKVEDSQLIWLFWYTAQKALT